MSETYLAHSAKNEYPAQSYADHVNGTIEKALHSAKKMAEYCVRDEGQIENIVRFAAEYHDLGKLNGENQKVLHQQGEKKHHLPVNHVDAGAAFMKQAGHDAMGSLVLIYSHHQGLPNIEEEENRSEEACFRSKERVVRDVTDAELERLLSLHRSLIPERFVHAQEYYEGDFSVFLRMVFSCLTDADHSDTAGIYGQRLKEEKVPELLPELRLESLDDYVNTLRRKEKSRRNELRMEMYEACKNSESKEGIVFHDGPVGSGKTTAVMAFQLRRAMETGARHIFVILPYTNIISQSVKVYREALVLPGENPEEVVAELHCKADFQSKDTRYLNALWRAPIIVTTAVAFFETLSSNRASTLRRLHELPGSVIFVDEAHAALPLKLMPLAWHWMKILEEEWSCSWILASGSLVRFWEISELVGNETKQISEMVSGNLRQALVGYEKNRVQFCWNPAAQSREGLAEWVMNMPGPRILIMNTVQSAAVIADDICKKYGKEKVEHLSTALLPADREKTIQTVEMRLREQEDTDWILVATSCVEAGVNFSFRTGFRETASLLSLLQTAGRINRNGTFEKAQMWSFRMQDDNMMTLNRDVSISAEVLEEYFETGCEITPELSTTAIQDELKKGVSLKRAIQELEEAESSCDFPKVEKEFCVIENDSITVVIHENLVEQIKLGYGSWRDIQKYSVSIHKNKKNKWGIRQIADDVYQWTLPYDSFLGYMAGVLKQEKIAINGRNHDGCNGSLSCLRRQI